jgi:nitroreductase
MSERKAAHDIAPMFLERWSPRAFTDEQIPYATLLCCFEAARWAPSGFNLQPWRFIYAMRSEMGWDDLLDLLSSTNRMWACRAAALILVVSKSKAIWNGQEVAAISNSFDAGAAWSNFAHQASALGWATHAMGGFDRERARARLHVPEDFAIEAVVAIGRAGASFRLPANLREREIPSDRRPLEETIMQGRFRSL